MTAPRGVLTMFRQILAGLLTLDTDVAFLCEHDLLYHPSHFAFTPPDRDRVYYNTHVYKLDVETGQCVTYRAKQVSGICADRALLVEHYRTRVERVARDGFSLRMGYEPGTHRRAERVDDLTSDEWRSNGPNIDLRHGANLTPSRWDPAQFRTPPADWRAVTAIPGWPSIAAVRASVMEVGAV
jgi:hypothetical protein